MRFYVLGALAIAVLVTFAAWMTVDVWYECREQHSFWYCYHVVFK